MTKIEWTDETWNPIVGCSKISSGCDNCYAENMAGRVASIALAKRTPREPSCLDYYVDAAPYGRWKGKAYLVEEAIDKPIHWKKHRMIFVCSMGDLFHESVPFDWIDQVFTVMAYASRHTFQVLTKRPERMMEYVNSKDTRARLSESILNVRYPIKGTIYDPREKYGWPLHNVWLGVTAENQEQANKRIPTILATEASLRFVSIEPMLEKMSIEKYFIPAASGLPNEVDKYHDWIDWVIVGGESGSKARPLHPDWVRSIRDQCKEIDVPFFFKQWGEYIPSYSAGMNSESLYQWMQKFGQAWVKRSFKFPDGMVVVKVGKKQSGSKLDEIEHKQIPSWK